MGSNVIKIVNSIIIVLHLLSANYLYYCIYVPVNYNCTYLLKPHYVDSYFIKSYTHEYDLRTKRSGDGISLFIADSLAYTCRNYIHLNSIFIQQYYNRHR